MRKQTKSLFALTSSNFEALEDDLVEKNSDAQFKKSIRQVEDIFLHNKVLDQMIKQEHEKTKAVQDNLKNARKRILKIRQLNRLTQKESSSMKLQAQKFTDAMAINKVLMMEKLLRLQRQEEDKNKRKQVCNRVRIQRQLNSQNTKFRNAQKLQRVKLQSLNNSFNIRQQLKQIRCNTMDMKRKQADEVRSIHERQKSRSKKIHSWKQQRAKNNYLSKVAQLKGEIMNKEELLLQIMKAERIEEKKVQTTHEVTQQYLNSFFTTQNTTL